MDMNLPGKDVRFNRIAPAWLCVGWVLVLLVISLSLRPGPAVLADGLGDKLQHVLAYTVLMLWFATLYRARATRVAYAGGFVALGVALEFIQGATGYRSFEVADMVADAIGVALGWLLAPPRLPSLLEFIERVLSRMRRGDSR